MAKMSMTQELEALRAEVERLNQKQAEAAEQQQQQQDEEAQAQARSTDSQEPLSGESVLGETPEMAKELRQQVKGLIAQVEEEYDNLSPTIAVLIFALGAVFGRTLSSK